MCRCPDARRRSAARCQGVRAVRFRFAHAAQRPSQGELSVDNRARDLRRRGGDGAGLCRAVADRRSAEHGAGGLLRPLRFLPGRSSLSCVKTTERSPRLGRAGMARADGRAARGDPAGCHREGAGGRRSRQRGDCRADFVVPQCAGAGQGGPGRHGPDHRLRADWLHPHRAGAAARRRKGIHRRCQRRTPEAGRTLCA